MSSNTETRFTFDKFAFACNFGDDLLVDRAIRTRFAV